MSLLVTQEECIGSGVWFRPKSAVGDPEGGDVGCRCGSDGGLGCHALVSSSLVTHDVWIWLSCIGIVVIGNAQEKCIGGGVWFRPKSAVGDPEGGDVGCR